MCIKLLVGIFTLILITELFEVEIRQIYFLVALSLLLEDICRLAPGITGLWVRLLCWLGEE